MKNKTHYLIILISVLYFSIIFQGSYNLLIERNNKAYKTTNPVLSTSDSVIYEWNRTWGGVGDEFCTGVTLDSSSNIYLAGMTGSFGAGFDMVLVKFSKATKKDSKFIPGFDTIMLISLVSIITAIVVKRKFKI